MFTNVDSAVLVCEMVEEREGPARHAVAVEPQTRRFTAGARRAVGLRCVREHFRSVLEYSATQQSVNL